MMVHSVAKSLGLSVDLRAICKDEYDQFCLAIPTFRHEEDPRDYNYNDAEDRMDEDFLRDTFGGGVKSTEDVRWCFESEFGPAPILSSVCFGNEAASAMVFYQNAALLVEVPAFSEESGKAADSHEAEDELPAKRFKQE